MAIKLTKLVTLQMSPPLSFQAPLKRRRNAIIRSKLLRRVMLSRIALIRSSFLKRLNLTKMLFLKLLRKKRYLKKMWLSLTLTSLSSLKRSVEPVDTIERNNISSTKIRMTIRLLKTDPNPTRR